MNSPHEDLIDLDQLPEAAQTETNAEQEPTREKVLELLAQQEEVRRIAAREMLERAQAEGKVLEPNVPTNPDYMAQLAQYNARKAEMDKEEQIARDASRRLLAQDQ